MLFLCNLYLEMQNDVFSCTEKRMLLCVQTYTHTHTQITSYMLFWWCHSLRTEKGKTSKRLAQFTTVEATFFSFCQHYQYIKCITSISKYCKIIVKDTQRETNGPNYNLSFSLYQRIAYGILAFIKRVAVIRKVNQ